MKKFFLLFLLSSSYLACMEEDLCFETDEHGKLLGENMIETQIPHIGKPISFSTIEQINERKKRKEEEVNKLHILQNIVDPQPASVHMNESTADNDRCCSLRNCCNNYCTRENAAVCCPLCFILGCSVCLCGLVLCH